MAVSPCLKREQLMEPERRGSKSWKCSDTCIGGEWRGGEREKGRGGVGGGGEGGGDTARHSVGWESGHDRFWL